MRKTFSQLPDSVQNAIKNDWQGGIPAVQLDRSHNLREGTVRDTAYQRKWRRDAAHSGFDKQGRAKPPSVDQAIWERDLEIAKLRDQNKALRKQYRQAVKDIVIADRLSEVARDTLLSAEEVTPYSLDGQEGEEEEHRVVALFSDSHVGEVVSADETNNLGGYNLDIFDERLQRWTARVIELVEQKRAHLYMPKLNVFMLGDIISGDIHDELVSTNDVNVVDQTVYAAQMISRALLTLAEYFEEIDVSGVAGNHGRMARKPYYKNKQRVNWDYLSYQIMQTTLQNQDNIVWHIPSAFWTVRDVIGTKFLMLHGDGMQSWMGIPYYAINRLQLKLMDLIGKDVPFDRLVMGHYHDPVDTEKWHVNGNFKGADEYSLGKMQAGCRPSQTLLYVHPRHSIIGADRVYLDEPGENTFTVGEESWLVKS